MERLNIGIAGCGIAGLASALLLHRQGHHITLYERFAEPRPIGSGLMVQPTGMAVFKQLGLAQKITDHGAPIRALYGENDHGEAVLEADYGDLAAAGVFGLGIHRASLFSALYDAALGADISIETDRPISGSELCVKGRALSFEGGGTSPAHDVLVDAMGVNSPLVPKHEAWLDYGALWTTLRWKEGGPFDETLLEQRYKAASRMIGILPTGKRLGSNTSGAPNTSEENELSFFWSLRGADYAKWQDDGMEAWKRDILDLWPECEVLSDQLDDPAKITFADYAHRTLDNPVEERLIHIGDAWHCASPQLGQGANMALLDAWALSLALSGDGSWGHGAGSGASKSPSLAERLDAAIGLRRSHVRLYQWMTAGFTPAYQSSSMWPPALRDIVLAPASRLGPAPKIKASLVAGLIGNPLGTLGLSLPDYERLRGGS